MRILFAFIFSVAFVQDPYETFIKAFGESYSTQNFAAVYDLSADSFKTQVTKEQVVQVLTGVYAAAGNLVELKEIKNANGGKVYHLIGEKATFELFVALDDKGKAAGLYIKPAETGPTDSKSLIEKWKADKNNAGLIVGKIINGKVDVQYYGVADKTTNKALDVNSVFEIGSISKPLTGILLQLMIAEGKISLDDPANKFLPTTAHLPQVNGKDILIRHLVTHSSCLPRMPTNFNPPANEQKNPFNYYAEKDLLEMLPTAQYDKGCVLGETSVYSNLGAGLVGYILTKVSGKSYSDLFNERLAKPLKTKTFGVTGASNNWVSGHTDVGVSQPQWTFTDALVGAGGVDASADDLIKVLTFFMKPDQSALGKAVVASTTVVLGDLTNGAGTFWIRQSTGGKNMVWHNGQTGGFNAFLGWIEGTQTGVFILSNNGRDQATPLGAAILSEEANK